MKKLLLLTLAVMLFVPLNTVFANTFSDVGSSNIYYKQINYLKDNNIVNGYEDGTFGDQNEIKRNEFIKILINSKFSSTVINTCISSGGELFTDVPASDVFAPYICVAKNTV